MVRCIKPSDTDPAIKQYDRVDYVLFNENSSSAATLLVFLTGTGGEPPGPIAFLHTAADAGYRVISLDYNDEPAVAVYCPRKPPACSGDFRRMRIFGDGISIDPSINNTGAESIVNRLVKLLASLDRQDPHEHWRAYLDNGSPNWSRIALAGRAISPRSGRWRAILFSSPWDFVVTGGNVETRAPRLATPAATPPERWFGGYHARENMAALLAKSFLALRIPPRNMRVFKGDMLPQQKDQRDQNPYTGWAFWTRPTEKTGRFFSVARLDRRITVRRAGSCCRTASPH